MKKLMMSVAMLGGLIIGTNSFAEIENTLAAKLQELAKKCGELKDSDCTKDALAVIEKHFVTKANAEQSLAEKFQEFAKKCKESTNPDCEKDSLAVFVKYCVVQQVKKEEVLSTIDQKNPNNLPSTIVNAQPEIKNN